MWQTCKRLLSLQAKMLEIRYGTWKRHREIARAYGETRPLIALVKFSASRVRIAAVGIGLVALAILLYTVAPLAVRSIASAARSVKHALVARPAQPPSQQPPARQPGQSIAPAEKPLEVRAPAPQLVAPVKNVEPVKTVEAPPAPPGQEPFDESMLYCIVANKAARLLYVLKRDRDSEPWRVVEQCPAVMGSNEGRKRAAGDRRTPEGTYFIIGRKDGWELSAIYGPLAYVLNYPNEEDRRAGRTGEGIWIHGMPEDSSRMETHGCVVLHNDYLVKLSQYLRLGVGTPVIIVDGNDNAPPERYPDFAAVEQKRKTILNEYRQRQRDFADLLSRWKHAWETKAIDDYSHFYDREHFVGGGLSWPAWRERKVKTFEMYASIGISLDKIRIVDFSESTAVVVFVQSYESEMLKRQNAKKLSLVKNGGQWLINREETFSNEEFFL